MLGFLLRWIMMNSWASYQKLKKTTWFVDVTHIPKVMPIWSNFAQMFPRPTPNSKHKKITWFWGHMRVLFWQKFHKHFPWIIYLHCHPIIQLDRFGKKNSTSGICKSMRIHAVIFVQPMCLESVLKENFLAVISWPPCSCHSFSAPAVFFVCTERDSTTSRSRARVKRETERTTAHRRAIFRCCGSLVQTSIHAWWKPYWRTRTIPPSTVLKKGLIIIYNLNRSGANLINY